ncbi:hypothetical protein FRC01_010040, partial [Tulasnella sp. 417]
MLEWLGYMFRIFALAGEGPEMYSFLVASQTFLIVTPALLVAQGYIVVERMMTFVGKEYGFTDHKEITRIFLGADVVAIVMQAIGSSVLTEARGDLYQAKVAKKILVAGLLLQIIPLGIYFCLALAFDFRSLRDPALRVYGTQMKGLRKLWIAFYVSAVLITLRSIYRAVEFAEIAPGPRGIYDPDKYLFTHEWPFYVFDAVPILGDQVQSSSQDAPAHPGLDSSFNMKITSETFLLDLNESFAGHLMAGNSAGDATFAAPAPPSPKRRARGRRTPSPDKPPRAFNFGFRKPNEDVMPDEQVRESTEPSEEALPPPTSSTQQPPVRNDKKSEAKGPFRASQPFPTSAGSVGSSGSNKEGGSAPQSSSSDPPAAVGADSGAKQVPRRKSLIARPVSARVSSAPSNAWLYRKSSQIMEPTPSASSSPTGGEAESTAPKSSAAEPSNPPPSEEPQTVPSVSEPAVPAFRKIVKLKRTGLTRVSRSGNSGLSDSQTSSHEEPMRQAVAPAPTDAKGTDKSSPTPAPSLPAPTSEGVSKPDTESLKAATQADPPRPEKETPPEPSLVATSRDSPSVNVTEPQVEPAVAPAAENDSEP